MFFFQVLIIGLFFVSCTLAVPHPFAAPRKSCNLIRYGAVQWMGTTGTLRWVDMVVYGYCQSSVRWLSMVGGYIGLVRCVGSLRCLGMVGCTRWLGTVGRYGGGCNGWLCWLGKKSRSRPSYRPRKKANSIEDINFFSYNFSSDDSCLAITKIMI